MKVGVFAKPTGFVKLAGGVDSNDGTSADGGTNAARGLSLTPSQQAVGDAEGRFLVVDEK